MLMEEVSILLDESSLHEVEINETFEKGKGVHIDLDDIGKCSLLVGASSLHEGKTSGTSEKENRVHIDIDDIGKWKVLLDERSLIEVEISGTSEKENGVNVDIDDIEMCQIILDEPSLIEVEISGISEKENGVKIGIDDIGKCPILLGESSLHEMETNGTFEEENGVEIDLDEIGKCPILLDEPSLIEVEISGTYEKENGVNVDLDDIGKCPVLLGESSLRGVKISGTSERQNGVNIDMDDIEKCPILLDERSLIEVEISGISEKKNGVKIDIDEMGKCPILLDESSLREVEISGTFEKENGVNIDLDDIGKCPVLLGESSLHGVKISGTSEKENGGHIDIDEIGKCPILLDESSLDKVEISGTSEKENGVNMDMDEIGKCPILLDESSLHEVEISGKWDKENEVYIDLDDIGKKCGFIESNDRLRGLFDEALRTFLSEKPGGMSIRPIPVSCSDGRHVDLLKLFWVVKKIGGCDMVCVKHLWGFVVEQCGLGSEVRGFLKSVYVRYLREFEQWLWSLYKGINLDVQSGNRSNLDLLVQELAIFEESLMSKGVENKTEGGFIRLTYDENSKAAGLIRGGGVVHLLQVEIIGSREEVSDDNKNDDGKLLIGSEIDLERPRKRGFEEVINELTLGANQWLDENGGKASSLEDSEVLVSAKRARLDFSEVEKNSESHTNEDNIVLSAKNDLEEGSASQKLKRESFSSTNLLEWIRNVAKHADDLRVGKIPKCSMWENHVWLQALAVRKARLLDRNTRSRDIIRPLRMTPWKNGLMNSVQKRSRKLCKECVAAGFQVANGQNTELGDKEKQGAPKKNKEKIPKQKQVLEKGGIEYILSYKSRTHRILVGSKYQAKVPEWTGSIVESDSKWLGTRIFPPEGECTKSTLSLLPIGRGRGSSCDCESQNSVECVRFHIAENRLTLRRELGSLFYGWRFDRMGEEVSLSWTSEEEDKFKEVIRSNVESFWGMLAKTFPSKTREMLVSYFFNAYKIQVRSYQNRITPTEIDSDDEEKEYETIGEKFGYQALKGPNSSSLVCVNQALNGPNSSLLVSVNQELKGPNLSSLCVENKQFYEVE